METMKKLARISLLLSALIIGVQAHAQDAAAGKAKAAMCMGCHSIPGYQASFPEVYKVPALAGQNAKYIVAALAEYAKGERKHPTMRSISQSLSEQDTKDLAAFFEQLGRGVQEAPIPDAATAPPPAVAALIAKANCQSCHGPNFSKPLTGNEPKLAGQHADYLYAALKAYQTSNSAVVGRSNAIMGGMVQGLNHDELHALANYLSTLPTELHTVPESRFRFEH